MSDGLRVDRAALLRVGVRVGMLAAGLILGFVVLWFACLREDQLFWRNEGGYPVAFRSLVYGMFYPLLLLEVCLAGLLSFLLLRHPVGNAPGWIMELSVGLALWMLVACTVVIVLGNNVANLIEGRSLHAHPEVSGR